MPDSHDDDDARSDKDVDFDADFDLSRIIGDSNAGAYQRVEERTGPPLALDAVDAEGSVTG